jgi:ATP-dependent Lon protease
LTSESEPKKKEPQVPEQRQEASNADETPVAAEPAQSEGDQPEGALPADHYYVVPVRNMVLFPGVVLPLMIGRQRSVAAIQKAVETESRVALLLQKEESVEKPSAEELYTVGTISEIVRYLSADDGRHHAICQGEQRCRIVEFVEFDPLPIARIEVIEETEPDPEDTDIEARFIALKEQAREVLQLAPGTPEDLENAVENIGSPSMLADMIATFMDVPVEERQEVLETFDIRARLELVANKLGHVAEVLRLSKKIRDETQGTLEQAQREYYLREQLRAIQRELGDAGESSSELAELEEKISAADMPEDAGKEARKELARLSRMPDGAAEASIVRTFLDVMVELPWSVLSDDRLNIGRAREILDEDHHGLEKVKERIVEFLAVRQLRPEGKSQSLCLVGPPGVGKTSLGRSVARAMGREFVRASLGGVHDEAEVRGHRRTYVGAMPGNIIQGLRKAGTRNPVFMLDEMDKLGRGVHGDPSSALLEVLDPEQNHTFRDNYLGVPFDLQRVLFISTANILAAIPPALRDRFEVIHLPGYTREEKREIAGRYLVARCLENTGLSERQCSITAEAISLLIKNYTREAGVRDLERQIGAICRHVATRIVEKSRRSMKIRSKQVLEILGPPRFEGEQAMRCGTPGVATGLAWTRVGGEILFVEAMSMPGKGRLIKTGQLGDVMQESAVAAMSLVKSHAKRLGIGRDVFEQHDVHVHMPAGAIPKDGPSAGVALYTALVSLFTERLVRAEVAMTGEVSLRGLVLPVGGIKEKVLGALAAGIEVVVLPKRNEVDLEDIPDEAREQLEFHFVEHVDQVLEVALASEGRKQSATRKRGGKASGKKKASRKKAGKKKASRKKASKKKASKKKASKKKASKKKAGRKKAGRKKAGKKKAGKKKAGKKKAGKKKAAKKKAGKKKAGKKKAGKKKAARRKRTPSGRAKRAARGRD